MWKNWETRLEMNSEFLFCGNGKWKNFRNMLKFMINLTRIDFE